jgi:hypothetical protein
MSLYLDLALSRTRAMPTQLLKHGGTVFCNMAHWNATEQINSDQLLTQTHIISFISR